MKKIIFILIFFLLNCGCCSLYRKYCHNMPIVDDQTRPIIFLADTQLPRECTILFEMEFSEKDNYLELLDDINTRTTSKEKILVLIEKLTFHWLHQTKLLQSQNLFIENCHIAIKEQRNNLLERNMKYCANYDMKYSSELDRCVSTKK